MGIPSLNSAILYNVSLYFHCHLERAQRVEKSKSCKYNKYPGPVHENRHFHGRQAHFSVPIHENAPFCG